jgi:hypothetical protein
MLKLVGISLVPFLIFNNVPHEPTFESQTGDQYLIGVPFEWALYIPDGQVKFQYNLLPMIGNFFVWYILFLIISRIFNIRVIYTLLLTFLYFCVFPRGILLNRTDGDIHLLGFPFKWAAFKSHDILKFQGATSPFVDNLIATSILVIMVYGLIGWRKWCNHSKADARY